MSNVNNFAQCAVCLSIYSFSLPFLVSLLLVRFPVILMEQELLPFRTAELIPVILVEQELLPFRTAEFIPVILVEQELLPFRTVEFILVF
jgi:hypothetical protein